MDCFLEEDLKWRQRAKQKWLREGDRNTKYFHMCANQRKNSNAISKVSNGEGFCASNQEDISNLFQLFYQYLFTTSQPKGITESLSHLGNSVTDDMNLLLLKEFTTEEIETAIFEMNSLSSPGLDGFPTFLPDHCNIVGSDVVNAVKVILNSNSDFKELNETFITLIPRKQRPRLVTIFHPISLCNFFYK